MSIINGNLISDMSNYHCKGNAELAVIDIDSKYQWSNERSDAACLRREKQQSILFEAKRLDCRIVCVWFHSSVPSYIKDVVDVPDFAFEKSTPGVLCDKKSLDLLNFLKSNNVTSTIIMGGFLDRCVHLSIVGGYYSNKYEVAYSGLLSHGYNVLTAPDILYHGSSIDLCRYSISPIFSPDATRFQEQRPYDLIDRREVNDSWSWPVFSLQKGVRIYTSV